MLRLIGALMIVAGGTAWGFFEADKMKRRIQKLERIIFALKLLDNEVAYGKRDIKSTLHSIGKSQGLDFLVYASEKIEISGIKAALCDALRIQEKELLETDKAVLERLWGNLGMTDSTSQVKAICHTTGILEETKLAAEKEYEKMGKLKRSMGFFVGAFVVILLL